MAHVFNVAGMPQPPKPPAPPVSELAPPPNSMPGYCVAVGIPGDQSGHLFAAVVVEMGWADRADSSSYVNEVPFGVGDRILFHSGMFGATPQVDGYLLVPVQAVVAWTPRPEGGR